MSCYNDAMHIRTPNDIGHLVRDRRKAHGWTQDQFATRLSVSRLWIVQLEQGKTTAQVGLVLRALNELDVPLQVDLQPQARQTTRINDAIDLDDIIKNATGPTRR